jgi:hypothetical protein
MPTPKYDLITIEEYYAAFKVKIKLNGVEHEEIVGAIGGKQFLDSCDRNGVHKEVAPVIECMLDAIKKHLKKKDKPDVESEIDQPKGEADVTDRGE